MNDLDMRFSDNDLSGLTWKRRLFFLLTTFFATLCIVFYVLHKYYNKENLAAFIPLVLVLSIVILFFCLSRYKRAVMNTAYRIIAGNFGWDMYTGGPQLEIIYSLYQNCLIKFGLLHDRGHVQFNDNIQGQIENYKFTLENISWIEPRRTKHGERDTTVAEYNLLTTDTPCPIDCNILIKKNTMLKWGIKKLERLKIENKEFEKYYDVYTDNPEIALGILSGDFLYTLLNYNRINKRTIELIITPKQVFFYQNTGMYCNILSSPRTQCQKVLQNINTQLNILSLLNLLTNK